MSIELFEYKKEDQIEFCRNIEIHLSKSTRLDEIYKNLDESIGWYNEKELRKMTLRIILCDNTHLSIKMMKLVTEEIRKKDTGLKQHPQILLYISIDNINNQVLDVVESLDTISPRITIVIVWTDGILIKDLKKNLANIMQNILSRNIKYHHFFYIVHSSKYINSIREYFAELQSNNNELSRFVFNGFPVIDISYDIPYKSIDCLVSDIIELWLRFPELNESIFLSHGGLLTEFFKCKEYCYLSNLKDFNKNSLSYLIKDSSNNDISLYTSLLIKKLQENDLYTKCDFKNNPIALDNDWDFVFDSYVCQSPILAAGPLTSKDGE